MHNCFIPCKKIGIDIKSRDNMFIESENRKYQRLPNKKNKEWITKYRKNESYRTVRKLKLEFSRLQKQLKGCTNKREVK